MNFSFIFLQNEHGNIAKEKKTVIVITLCCNSNCLVVQLKLESETLCSVGLEGTEHEVSGPLSLSLRGAF